MHDRENAGALEVVLGRRDRIGETASRHSACSSAATGGRGAMKPSISPSASSAEIVLPSGASSSFTSGGQLDGDFLRPVRLPRCPPRDPVDVGRLDAVVVFQNGARPHIGGQLIFRHADFFALEVVRLLDAVGAHIDRGVAEGARHERRHADIGAVALRGLDREARQRQFANVEFGVAEGAEEDFLRRRAS